MKYSSSHLTGNSPAESHLSDFTFRLINSKKRTTISSAQLHYLSIFLMVIFFLAGCSGGGSENGASVTGRFIDDAVLGLNYRCSSGATGVTNSSGEFTCDAGDDVDFILGGSVIGSIAAQGAVITPYTLFPNELVAARNFARLLQTIDADNDPDNGIITIDESFVLPPGIDFSSPTFAEDIEAFLATALVSIEDAKNHLHSAILAAGGTVPYEHLPVANAGPDQTLLINTAVTVDGSASSDGDSDPLTYQWVFIDKPNGSNAAISSDAQVSPTFTADSEGSYVLQLVVDDGTGNSAVDTIVVTVLAEDVTAPVITVLGDDPASVAQDAVYTDAGATATDDIDGAVSVASDESVDTSAPGVYVVTYTASDNAGNTATTTRAVNVTPAPIMDTTPPVIVVNGDNPASVVQGAAYADAGATATDNIDGAVNVTSGGIVDTSVIDIYTVTYTATDNAGNTASVTRTVNITAPPIIDTTAPVITVLGDNPASVVQGDSYTDAGATATDGIDGVVSVTADSTVDTTTVGVYSITYTATDSSGNSSTISRVVNVIAASRTLSGIVTDEPVVGATVGIYTIEGVLIADAITNNEGRFSVNVPEDVISSGFEVIASNGEMNGEVFSGELRAIYSSSADPQNINTTPLTTLIHYLTSDNDGRPVLANKQSVLDKLDRIGMVSADQANLAEPNGVNVSDLQEAVHQLGFQQWVDGIAADIEDEQLTVTYMRGFPNANGGVVSASLGYGGVVELLRGEQAQEYLEIHPYVAGRLSDYAYQLVNAPEGASITDAGIVKYTAPIDAAVGSLPFNVYITNTATGKTRIVPVQIRILDSEVVVSGVLGTEGGVLTDEWEEIILTVPEGAVTGPSTFQVLRSVDENGYYIYTTNSTMPLEKILHLRVPDARLRNGSASAQRPSQQSRVANRRDDTGDWKRWKNWGADAAEVKRGLFMEANPVNRFRNDLPSGGFPQHSNLKIRYWYDAATLHSLCGGEDEFVTNCAGRDPVLFVHGFSARGGFDVGGTSNGGGKGTWGKFPELLQEEGYAVFESLGVTFPAPWGVMKEGAG